MLREMSSVFGKKSTHYYIDNHFFSFFWVGDVKQIYIYFRKHIYFTKYKSRTFKCALFRGDRGARMYIKYHKVIVIGMFVMAEQS